MSEEIKEILELTTNQVGDIIIDYIDNNEIKQEWEYCCDKDILNYIINLQNQLQQKEKKEKEIREYANTDKNCVPKHIKDYINNLLDKEVN